MIGEALSVAAVVGTAAVRWWRSRREAAARPDTEPAPAPPPDTPDAVPLAPAYPGLVAASPEVRIALRDVARALNLSPAALATVIESESGWDPTVPREERGTPRGGLLQVTVGARLPGFADKAAVWGIRAMPAAQQLRELAPAFFGRFEGRKPEWTALDVYKRLFLPADAGRPHDFKLGVRPGDPGAEEPVVKGGKLTRGDVYAANGGFDRPPKKGFITWDDVAARVREVEGRAKGRWVTVGGALVDPPSSGPAPGGAAQPTAAPAREPPPEVAASIRLLLRQVNERWPLRSKASDGTLGDAAHRARARKSDHNDGTAIDFTLDSARGPDLEALALALLADARTKYVIFNKRIASRDKAAGAWRPYDGQNPHTRHLHLSILPEARDDVRPWRLPDATGNPAPGEPAPATPAPRKLPGLVDAWRRGLVDNVTRVDVEIGPFVVGLAADALSVEGVRVPISWREEIELCALSEFIPNTRAFADARWRAAARRVVLAPLGVPGSAELAARFPDLEAQAREWSRRIGPPARELVDGPWKVWIVEADLKQGAAVNYGLRRADGSVWQTPGHAHDAGYSDYSQLCAPVYRYAQRKATGERVDLVEVFAAAGPEADALGGPWPAWLVEAIR